MRNRGVVEAGGVVLDGERVRVAVEGEAPDSVDLTRIGKSEGDRLGWRCCITEDHIHSRHVDRIAVL